MFQNHRRLLNNALLTHIKGCIGTIVDEGQQFDWIVSFDLAPKIRIEVDMQEYNLKEIKKHSST